jgi:hypothetical protein
MLVDIEYTKNSRRRKVNAKVAKILIGRGLARAVEEAVSTPQPEPYTTRMLQAEIADPAPYGYKADGTPRKRPAPRAKADKEA